MKQAKSNIKAMAGRTIRSVLGREGRRFAAAFLGGLVTVAPVWADDTEIFFGDTSAGGVAPNMLLVVDTSGSMSNTVSGTGKTRMQNVQDAMHILLNSLNNVNVGLMRFSNPGGPVLYQIDNLDRNVNELTGIVDVSSTVEQGSDDAQQVIGGSVATLKDIFDIITGTMIIDSSRLDITRAVVGSADVYTREVQDFSDDAEEEVGEPGDNVLRGNNDLEMTHDDGNASELHVVGVRFAGTQVPAGATITNAYVTFKVDNVGAGGTAEMTISGEYGPSARFADLNDDISSRTRTASAVQWDLANPAGNSIVNTPSLTAVVQDIVNHPDWKGDGTNISDMTFIFERRGGSTAVAEHDFQAYDRGDFIPTLTVEYYVGSPPEEKDTVTGLRFTNVDVPKGVTITNAFIDFTVAQTDSTETTNLLIAGELSPNPATYSDSAKIATRARTTTLVEWTDLEAWTTSGETKTTPDLKEAVQEIVNQSDWCGGNPMAFMIAGEGLRSAWAKDADNGLQPVLRVSYDSETIVPGASCSVASMAMQITDSDDDVEEDGSDVWTSSDDLDFQSTSRHVGLRFPNINLPKDAKILEAWIEFVAKNNYSGNTTVKIEPELTDNSVAFGSGNGTVDSRTWGTALDWNITENWVDVQTHRTTDISSLVQSTVERAGWSLGNAMAFRMYKSSGTTRAADSFNRDPVRAPRLVVRYQDDGTAAADVRLVRQEILEEVDKLNTSGYTPIQDTLYEAALYYTGGKVDFGKKRGGPNDGGPHAYTRVSVGGAMVNGTYTNNYPSGCSADNLGDGDCRNETLTGAAGSDPTYKSPIVDWCQKESHIILLTDGQANRPHSEAKIKDFIDKDSCDGTGVNSSEICVKELVSHLYKTDQSDLKEEQIIRTHTIGFNFSSQWLKDVAEAGGGQYKEATQASDLVAEVQEILTDVLKVNNTFVAPVAAINQFNRLNHRSEIYFAVFRPEETPGWPGNLKKYRIGGVENTILDYSTEEGEPAIDPATGFFSETAQSAWGGITDGAEVDVGGANKKMPIYTDRKIYTYYAGSTSTTLSDTVNLFTTNNANLTKAMLGVEGLDNDQFAEHIQWIRGRDMDDEDGNSATNENRYILGDPLHSKPVAVTYGGTEAEPDITVYFGSNSGFLHAINAETGVERFSFIPEDSYKKQVTLREASTASKHVYGIDGSVTAWVNDANNDGSISGDDEFVRLFVGQRRGGSNYYALDVTDRDNPKLMWQINGGSGDFAEMGQSWSRPVRGAIDVDGVVKDVLYITGGYDPDQDNTKIRAEDNEGRALFIVDALTGELIWDGGPTLSGAVEEFAAMKYSIPADVAVVDITSSGLDNILFVGDVGGQIWRFDIRNGAELDNLITGGVIADLGVSDGDNVAADNRRFYHSPDVALVIVDEDGSDVQKLAVAFGSGYQAHPLSTETDDRFYMILQDEPYAIPETYVTLTHDDLYDATDNDVGEGVDGAAVLLEEAEGYYFNTPNLGEKVLSTPLIFNNTITFTTYEPNPSKDTSRCIPAAGVTRVYQVSLLEGAPINDWDDVDGLTEEDRAVELKTTSIVDEPVIICSGGTCEIYVGPETPPSDLVTQDRIYKTFWRKE